MKRRLMALLLLGCLAFTACGSEEEAEDTVVGAEDKEAEDATEEEEEVEEVETEDTSDLGFELDLSVINGVSVVDVEMTADNLDEFMTMSEYKGMEIEKTLYTVTDEDVDAQITTELATYPIAVTDPNEVVELGDTINLDYSGSIDGVVFDGGTAQGQTLEIGSGMFIPGFEDQMIGMHVGESGEIEVTFPDDYGSTDLAGKDAVFAVTVNSISEYVDEVTEEWLLANTAYATVDDYREGVRANLEATNTSTSENEVMNTAWQNVVEGTSYNQYPKAYVDLSYEEWLTYIESTASMYGMGVSEILEMFGYTAETAMAEIENYVQSLMIMEYICYSEGLTTDSQEYLDKQTEILTQSGLASVEDAVAMGISEWNVITAVKNACVMDILVDNAVITEVPEVVEEVTE